MKPLEIGRVRLSNVVEWYGPTRPTWVLPEATKEGWSVTATGWLPISSTSAGAFS
jgi:hypothetical protein